MKRNQNGAFSIGKTWALDEIKQIQIVDVSWNERLIIYQEGEPNQFTFRLINFQLH